VPFPASASCRIPSGFTLVEMLIVLALLGLCIAIAAPRMRMDGFRLGAASHDLGSMMYAAQSAAVARQHDVVIAFDQSNRSVRQHFDRDNDGVRDSGEPVFEVSLQNGVAFGRGPAPALYVGGAAVTFRGRQDGMPAVTFHRSGSASEEGGFYLQSTAADGTQAVAAVLDRGTGLVTWRTYRGGSWQLDD
jgi:prepilin-type N-terminal cleavage/methylation domain-containing protein